MKASEDEFIGSAIFRKREYLFPMSQTKTDSICKPGGLLLGCARPAVASQEVTWRANEVNGTERKVAEIS
jgi:hypothetical protein